MKNNKLLLVLTLTLLLVGALTSFSFASKADELMTDAQTLATKAEHAKTDQVRDRNYKDAIDDYNTVIKNYPNTILAIQAQYNIARVYETAKKGRYANLRNAYDQYNKFIYQYDKPESELAKNFEPNEIPQVKSIIADAKQHKEADAAKLNEQNKGQTLYQVMDFLVKITGAKSWFSYWFAIILITIIVKVFLTPLTKAQFKSMKDMQKISPLIKEIQEKYKGDQKTMNEQMMQIYKDHNINPFASCLPILIQMPILWLVYAMIRAYEFQFAQGKFLWIGAVKNPIAVAIPFGSAGHTWLTAPNLAQPDLILVVLYLISMYVSTRLSAVDPSQAEQQKMMAIVMPVMFAFIFAGFPSAFLLYWLAFNIVQTVQQYLILREGPQTAPAAGTMPSGNVQPEAKPESAEEQKGEPSDDTPRRVRRRRRR